MEHSSRITTRSLVALVALALVTGRMATAATGAPPYLRLAQALGTPKLANANGPKDKSQLGLTFVRANETVSHWTRATLVSILKVPQSDTETAKRGVIARLRATIVRAGGHITAFEISPVAPVNATFAFSGSDRKVAGFVYSPRDGYVTVAQLDAKNGATITANDVAILHRVAQGKLP